MNKTTKNTTKEKDQKKKLDKIAELLAELFKKEDEFYLKNKEEKNGRSY